MLQAVASIDDQARGKGGKIINFASQAGRRGEALVAVYCASKAAVISITQSAGLALIKHGINVNGIAPGVVDTPMWDHVDGLFAKYENLPKGEKKRQVGESVPYGRMGRPRTMSVAPFSWPAPRATTSSPRPTMSMAAMDELRRPMHRLSLAALPDLSARAQIRPIDAAIYRRASSISAWATFIAHISASISTISSTWVRVSTGRLSAPA